MYSVRVKFAGNCEPKYRKMEIDELFDFNLLEDELGPEPTMSPARIVSEQTDAVASDVDLFSLFFSCSGDAVQSESTESVFKKDLKALLNNEVYLVPGDVELFNFDFDSTTLPIETLVKMLRMNVQKLACSTIDSFGSRISTFFVSRESVTKLMLILRCQYAELR